MQVVLLHFSELGREGGRKVNLCKCHTFLYCMKTNQGRNTLANEKEKGERRTNGKK
jgi:ribosomal protein L34